MVLNLQRDVMTLKDDSKGKFLGVKGVEHPILIYFLGLYLASSKKVGS
jgi:hypothetical protein